MDEQAVFHALGDPTRRAIVRLLAEQDLPVHTICSHFDISRPAVSRHLRVLREAQAVTESRQGREIRYRLNPLAINLVRDWTRTMSRYWAERLGALARLSQTDQEGDP